MCPEPACVAGCPVGIDIPGFIHKISDKDYRGRLRSPRRRQPFLPAICGRVCPQEDQCEGVCPVGDTLEPVAIGRLERWLGDRAIGGLEHAAHIEPNRFKVGIIGSGPAGMACAADMAKAGCDVTVYEALHEPGGVLRYGIPEFRLPNEVVDAEIANLMAEAGHRDQVQHPGRAAVHDRADARRDGLRRRLHRHRRRLAAVHGHTRRVP